MGFMGMCSVNSERPRFSRKRPDLAVDRRRSVSRALWADLSLPAELRDALWSDPDQLIKSGKMLKDGDRCTVVRIARPSTEVDGPEGAAPREHGLVLKRYNLKGAAHTAVHWFMRSRAMWCWVNGHAVMGAGLPTPTPLACVEDRRAGVLRGKSWFLSSYVEGTSLRDLVQKKMAGPDQLGPLASQFARIWRELGALRVSHGDMKASNFIIDPQDLLWLIDLDGMRRYHAPLLFRRERRNDIACFMRNWENDPKVAAIFRSRLGPV